MAKSKKKEAEKADAKPAVPAPSPRLLERYRSEVRSKLKEQFGIKNDLDAPRLTKIVVNMGVGAAKESKTALDAAAGDLATVTGQKPKITIAKSSVAGFKLREGMAIGCMVTLRGRRMYEFLDRLIAVAVPRIKDFRGLKRKSFDGRGNYSMGLSEQSVFPEIHVDKVQAMQGMDITMCTSTNEDAKAEALLQAMGMPFRER